jgi:hypothetical protein
MSVYTPKENHLVKQRFGSKNQELNSFGRFSETKYFEGIGSMEKAMTPFEGSNTADETISDNISGLPEVLNRFYEQGMNSLDTELTSQILSSIRNKLTSSMNHSPETSKEQDVSELTLIKQEIQEDFVNYNDSFDNELSYPQTSQAYHQNLVNHYSASSLESCSSNVSPDSSLNPSYASSASASPKELLQFGFAETDFGQSEQAVSCDSTQTASGTGGAKFKQASKQTNLLPPCRVCGDKASGFHYGANTCEACKV